MMPYCNTPCVPPFSLSLSTYAETEVFYDSQNRRTCVSSKRMVDFRTNRYRQVGLGTQCHPLYGSYNKEFGGLEGRWTPEELLLAALAGCFTTTLRAIAGNVQFDFTDLQVAASGTVRKAASGYSFSEIVLRPTMKIAELSERERALDLLEKTERLCLVARALDVPLRFEPQFEVTPAVVSV